MLSMANTVSFVLSLENTMSTVTNFVSITFFRNMGVDLSTYRARIGCFGGGKQCLFNTSNFCYPSEIHREVTVTGLKQSLCTNHS